jgi:hypothetical protein
MKPIEWDIRREGRRWSNDEFDQRIYQAPEKIEFVGGIFDSERERLNVLGMLLENLGIDKVVRFGKLEDCGLPPVFWSTPNGRPLGRAKYEDVRSSLYDECYPSCHRPR